VTFVSGKIIFDRKACSDNFVLISHTTLRKKFTS